MKIGKWLKWLGFLFAGLIAILGILYLGFNEPLPKGTQGEKAEALAQKMLRAVNKEAWDQTGAIQWTFKGVHDFVWDKQRHLTIVEWGEYRVLLDINKIAGKAWKSDQELSPEEAKPIVQTAWEYWCNDSFWLNAVVKAFDPGTTRSIVSLEDGQEGLLVSYSSGGVTPGDSYLWILDESGQPVAWKMWVSIIPIGGLEFSWEDWMELPTGAKIATMHKSSLLDLDMSNIKAGHSLLDLGFKQDPFGPIVTANF